MISRLEFSWPSSSCSDDESGFTDFKLLNYPEGKMMNTGTECASSSTVGCRPQTSGLCIRCICIIVSIVSFTLYTCTPCFVLYIYILFVYVLYKVSLDLWRGGSLVASSVDKNHTLLSDQDLDLFFLAGMRHGVESELLES